MLNFFLPKFCLLVCCVPSFFEEFHKIRRGFAVCFQNLTDEKLMKFYKLLQVRNNFTILLRVTIEMKQNNLITTRAESIVSK